MRDASAFAVTPETKLHRPTDLRGGGGFGGLRDRPVPTAFFPRVERCAIVVWRVEKGSFEIDPQTSRGQHAWQILYSMSGRHHVQLLV